MFIWVLVIVVVVAFCVYNWAELGVRMQGRNLWLVLGWSAVAVVAWQLALETLRFPPMLALLVLFLVLFGGYYHLHRVNPRPKLARAKKKSPPKKSRTKRAHK